MFDFGIGYTEIVVIAIIAVIVIGPKDLPKVLRALGRTVTKMRGMAREFQGHLDQAMREAGMDEVKKEVQNLKSAAQGVVEPMKTATTGIAKDLDKQDSDFKKYFGEMGTQAAAPAKAEEAKPVT